MKPSRQAAPAVPRATGVADRGAWGRLRIVVGLVFLASAAVAAATLPDGAPVGWGMVTATFIFLLGVTQFGVAFTAIMRLAGGDWARPMFRLAEVTTLAYAPFALIGLPLIVVLGGDDLFYWLDPEPGQHLSAWLGESVLLWRNLSALAAFYLAAYLYVRPGLRPDLDATAGGGLRGVVRAIFGGPAANADVEALSRRLYRGAIWMLLFAVLTNTFIAWDFAMMLWPHYHSTVFSMYYMVGCIYGGIALLLLLTGLVRRYVDFGAVFGTRQIKNTAIMLTGFMCLWLYFFWAQYFVSWFGNLPHEMHTLDTKMKGHYAPVFWTSIGCLFVLPLASLIFARVKRRYWSAAIVAGLILTGVFLNRYLMVVPARWDDHLPLSTIGGVSGSLALASGFVFVLLLLINAFPMLSAWEIERVPAAQRARWQDED